MNIKGTTVLVLGGAGMVGRAVCRELMGEEPARIVVASMAEPEVRAAIEGLTEEHRRLGSLRGKPLAPVEFIPEWGNIFVREGLHHRTFGDIVSDPAARRQLVHDTFEPLDAEALAHFFLYQMVTRHNPDIIVDAVNTATGVAYSDVFSRAREVLADLDAPEGVAVDKVERLLCSIYVPQLIRHVEILFRAMRGCGTAAYVKIGTSGTGGMGWNIPYTHGEERPSLLLLSKSAVAGAHSMLLFLQARTPVLPSFEEEEGKSQIALRQPLIKEIKPTAAIAWREIGYGEVHAKGKPIRLERVSLEGAQSLGDGARLELQRAGEPELTDHVLKTAYVDTGENGLFSTEEFITITSPGQMEFVTPEEIARNVVDEIRGVSTGHDVINALNVTSMGPTYRAGFQRERAIRRLRELEKQHGTESIAFEILGPPRLSKLLYEAHLLKRQYRTMEGILAAEPAEMSAACRAILEADEKLLQTVLTLGIPVLFEKDGELRLARGHRVKSPPNRGQTEIPVDHERLDEWAAAGWIDLRVENMVRWRARIGKLLEEARSIPTADTSSRYVRNEAFWAANHSSDESGLCPGEIVAWIFITEDLGERGRE